jgi:2-dehydro-3-deoxyphosphogluconate aldolase / (4S)-4-hydroxy-2-oxoglutarate aldolase
MTGNAMITHHTSNRTSILETVFAQKAVAVIRLENSIHALSVVQAIAKGGITIVEITLTTPNALDIIRELTRWNASSSTSSPILVGAGSVLDSAAAERCIEAGAAFMVSPVMKHEIIQTAHAAGIPAMMGAFTPSEILAAQEAGADIVKVFPADFLSPAYFKAVKAPMPHLRLMPTGGVTLTNAGDWLRAGACAVGIGGALLDAKAIAEERFDVLTVNAQTIVQSIEKGTTGIAPTAREILHEEAR